MASFTASAAAVAPVARTRVAANRARPTSVRSSSASLTVRKTERRAQRVVAPRAMSEIAQTALDLDEETITAGVAALLGLGAGLGIPISSCGKKTEIRNAWKRFVSSTARRSRRRANK